MLFLQILIQLISIYRAVSILAFILFYTTSSNILNSFFLITAISSDFLDGYLARKYHLVTTGGKLLDLFSDKYLNCISIVFLVLEGYPLLPLLAILTKEIFVLSFRSIEIDGQFIIPTNRTLGGVMTGALWLTVFFHVNHLFPFALTGAITLLGILNFIYLIYKIVSNFSNLKKVFQEKV